MAEATNNHVEYTALWWLQEIEIVEKYLDDKWRRSGDDAVRRYLDDRSDDNVLDDEKRRKYNIFWANTQIIKSALYATAPKPAIKRQHDDQKDDIARCAALILERIVNFGLDKDSSDMHAAFKSAVEDLLIPGLGQIWHRYEVETELTQPVLGTDGSELAPAGMRIIDESAPTDYVHWRDFLFSISRTWGEVWWVGRRCWMKKKQFVKFFGKEKWETVKSSAQAKISRGDFLPQGFTKGRVEVFEVWCEDTNRVYWLCRALEDFLQDPIDDPLKLEDFWPCPEPVLATHTTNAFVPRTDYYMAQDQYEELDILNQRIAILTKALRVVGVYDKTNDELKKLLTGGEFNMIPVDNWAAFAEQGGLKGQVDWFPVEVIAEVLERLMVQRQSVITQIYELTSISDIQRGASNPRETLGAQKLKAQYSSVRLQLKQQDVGKFVRHSIRLKCEIICKHWQPEIIKRVSQIDQTESAPYADQAIQLLKDFRASQYRVEVGEETLSLADYNAERELRSEYLVAVGQFVSQAGQILEVAPEAAPFLLKMISWVTASFRGSSDIETILDQAIQVASQPQGEKPDPAVVEAQAKKELAAMHEDTAKAIAMGKEETTRMVAKMQSDTQKEVAQLNNGTKLLIEQMANAITKQSEDNKAAQEGMKLSMDQMSQRAQQAHEALMQIMSGAQESVLQSQQLAGDGSSELKNIMKELMEVMKKPRIRVPERDKKTGDILSVTDKLGD